MKKRVINLTLFIATVLIGMNSCTNRKASVTEDVYNISSQDTAVVLKLASSCMDALQEGRTEAALEMMYVTRNDTLMPISNEQKVNMARRFKLFPVLVSIFFDYNTYTIVFSIKFCIYISKQTTGCPSVGDFTVIGYRIPSCVIREESGYGWVICWYCKTSIFIFNRQRRPSASPNGTKTTGCICDSSFGLFGICILQMTTEDRKSVV